MWVVSDKTKLLKGKPTCCESIFKPLIQLGDKNDSTDCRRNENKSEVKKRKKNKSEFSRDKRRR